MVQRGIGKSEKKMVGIKHKENQGGNLTIHWLVSVYVFTDMSMYGEISGQCSQHYMLFLRHSSPCSPRMSQSLSQRA